MKGGGVRHLLPLRSPVGGDGIVFLQDGSQGNRTRATLKAINAAPTPTSTTLAPTDRPASCLTSQLRLMRITAELSAVVIIHAFPNAQLRNQTTTKRPKTSPN